MKLCNKCEMKVWPYLIVAFIAGFSAFLTWLTLTASRATENIVFVFTATVFLGVLTLLSVYVTSCMRRHCDHQDEFDNRVNS